MWRAASSLSVKHCWVAASEGMEYHCWQDLTVGILLRHGCAAMAETVLPQICIHAP